MTTPHIDPERNREILAERGGWPDGAITAVRRLESQWPGWYAWWTEHPWRLDGDVPDPPCYGAAPVRGARPGYPLFAATTEELAEQIHEAEDERAALAQYTRPPWQTG